VGRGNGELHALVRAMLWIAGEKAVYFDEHDQAGEATRCRLIFSAARGIVRDRLDLLIGLRDRLAGIPSERDPELPATSTVQRLPSRWIKSCSNPTFVPCK
jgi:hypothetical protein